MKALSVKQPFAGLISSGQKTIEVRSWKTAHRGQVLICAGINAHNLFESYHISNFELTLSNKSARSKINIQPKFIKDSGCAMCLVDLTDITPFEKSHENDACCDWAPGLYAWHVKLIDVVHPVKVKGRLMLFDLPDLFVTQL